jgi:hypothetical protein
MKFHKPILWFAGGIAAQVCLAAEPRPAPGAYGFDWLKPDTAACAALKESDIQAFQSCQKHDGAFGLDDPVLVCRKNRRSEYFIYESKKTCVSHLEAMKANAP